MMAMQPPLQAAPKRPRLSLKINTCGGGPAFSGRPRGFPADATDSTAFNTLSNAYVTAMAAVVEPTGKDTRLRVTTPFASAPYPGTPVTAPSISPPQQQQQLDDDDVDYTSTMTPTPPLSAGADDDVVFSFSPKEVLSSKPKPQPQPYTHPRSLHSILRNSPLPPRTAIPPSSSRRQPSSRLHHKAAKRVCYNNPLTQTITTNKYTLSHIDLLVEEASPAADPLSCSPAEPEAGVDLTQAFSANEIQDGGQTPGPFEDLRRRLAGFGPGSPLEPIATSTKSGGIRKRRRRDKEKKRQWVWTIGVSQDGDDDHHVAGAMAADGEAMPKPMTVSETQAASISVDMFDSYSW